jgi:cytoplasmic iron level regulating protein YaaA (DUF328/UPF0246 family)
LPPSQSKRPGGTGPSIDKLAIIWAALEPTRQQIYPVLKKVSSSEKTAAKALKLGKKNISERLLNLELETSPTMHAIERYTGTLFEALDFQSLSEEAKQRAGERVLIQSPLFGLTPALEHIPNYRLSADSTLPGIKLKKIWPAAHEAVWPRLVHPILDMRSKDYVQLAPIPESIESYYVEVLDSKSGKALNHFNKKAKGLLARAALEQRLEDISQLGEVARDVGLRVEVEGMLVRVLVPESF